MIHYFVFFYKVNRFRHERQYGLVGRLLYRRISEGGKATLEDVLQKGTAQVAAGYIIYGSSTMLVYTAGNGVNGFTLDPSIGEFCLSYPGYTNSARRNNLLCKRRKLRAFSGRGKKYIKYCQAQDAATNRPYTARYIGSIVADVHRNLIKGGIFLYPAKAAAPNGKLRLVYECNRSLDPPRFIHLVKGIRAL
ncbi:MAG: class 1 fructose-bisphosphatase [Daejeonella sp.]